MFVCGPTIQDYIHVGHARTYVFYDLLSRYLRYLGFDVKFLLNITDVDESIVRGAKEKGARIDEFQTKFAGAFLEDLRALRIETVTNIERVSKYLPEMVRQVSGLLGAKKGYLADGSVYFDTTTFPDFGKLSHLKERELLMRPLEISRNKRNQHDFSLWRRTTDAEQQWSSPWGTGTPGWHIQDTAVSKTFFGPQYDIHGGARELIYPHHEAEIAQMESLTGIRPCVRYWVHTGLLTLRRAKMSKSEGNALYVRDVLSSHDSNALRLYLMGIHHTKDAEFSEHALKRWEERYWSMCGRFKALKNLVRARGPTTAESTLRPFLDSLSNDVESKSAIDYLAKILSQAVGDSDAKRAARFYSAAKTASAILGVQLDRN